MIPQQIAATVARELRQLFPQAAFEQETIVMHSVAFNLWFQHRWVCLLLCQHSLTVLWFYREHTVRRPFDYSDPECFQHAYALLQEVARKPLLPASPAPTHSDPGP